MKLHTLHRFRPWRAFGVWLLLAFPATAHEVSLADLVEGSRGAIKAENWEQALDFNTRAVTAYGQGNPLKSYGPQFGAILYHKGICEMKLKRWQEAMRSFEVCYRDFPNAGSARENNNSYEKLALLKWGEAAMGAEQWELAISRFSKFTEERDRTRDTFPQGAFHVNMAVCRYMTGHIAEGNESLEIAIRNKRVFPTPDDGIVAGFQALVRAVIQRHEEQALLDFVGKNRGSLIARPHVMHRYSQAFLKFAGDAAEAGMDRAALALYQMVPSTDEAIDDVNACLKSMGPATRIEDGRTVFSRADLERDLATLEAERRGRQSPETIKLAAIALLHESAGNPKGALAAYRQLETYFPNAEKREDNLFNLIRLSTIAGPGNDTAALADTFAKAFPDSSRLVELKRLLLSSLFAKGDYSGCIRVAEPMATALKEGTPDHEYCTYILGAAAYHEGRGEIAQTWLDRHVAMYPKGGQALPAAYFQASNASRLGATERAAGLLDAFLTKYPKPQGNPYLAEALYERALCHVSAKQPAAALEKINRILGEFPASPVVDNVYDLKAGLERSAGDSAAAEKDFLSAFEAARASGDGATAGEALASLVELLASDSKRSKSLIPHADRFWKDYAEHSPLRNRVAIAEVPAFVAAGRRDEAMDRLRAAILEVAGVAESEDLRPLIDRYATAYLTTHNPTELAQHFDHFPGIDPANRTVLAPFRMAVISAHEATAETSKDEVTKAAAAAAVTTLFQQFKLEFPMKELSSRDLLRLGDFLHLKTSTPLEALGYYDEVIRRDNARLRFAALLGRGDVLSSSSVPADLAASLGDFQAVYQNSRDRSERDYAWFRIIGLLEASGDHDRAAKEADAYLKGAAERHADFIQQVEWLSAVACEAAKRIDDAVSAYERLAKVHREEVGISAPAMVRWLKLSWEHAPDTRPSILDAAAHYLEQTRAQSEGAAGAWQELAQLVASYRGNPANDPAPPRSPQK